MIVKTVCDLIAFGVCWATVTVWLAGVVQPIIIILSATVTFIYGSIQLYEWNKKRMKERKE